jgi:hypothetical protein
MAIRTKFIAIVGALLGSLFIQVVSAQPGWAHPGHDHAPSATPTSHSAVQVPVAEAIVVGSVAAVEPAVDEHQFNDMARSVLSGAPMKTPQPFHPDNCCCGSIACHSGVAVAHEVVTPRESYGELFALPPVLARLGAMLGGIERPPRRSA